MMCTYVLFRNVKKIVHAYKCAEMSRKLYLSVGAGMLGNFQLFVGAEIVHDIPTSLFQDTVYENCALCCPRKWSKNLQIFCSWPEM